MTATRSMLPPILWKIPYNIFITFFVDAKKDWDHKHKCTPQTIILSKMRIIMHTPLRCLQFTAMEE